jgi:hypothetical protein
MWHAMFICCWLQNGLIGHTLLIHGVSRLRWQNIGIFYFVIFSLSICIE